MVRAILDGRKTQTRRVVKLPEGFKRRLSGSGAADILATVEWYAQPGDRLWVRETCIRHALPNFLTGEPTNAICAAYAADGEPVLNQHGFDYVCWWKRGEKCPSIHMPRWASRLTLEVVNVRVERLQEISGDDALAEGVDRAQISEMTYITMPHFMRERYKKLWDSINAKRGYGWDKNPYVWVIEFKPSPATVR